MRKRGFTLAESVIVLGLIAMSFTICWPYFSCNWDQFRQDQFFRHFRTEWQLAQSNAKTRHFETRISFSDDCVHFSGQNYHHDLQMPPKLKLRDHKNVTMHSDGYVRPCTWEFCSELDKHVYYMRIQMAWGGYRIEKGGLYTS
jgi:competence protein ComGD